MIVKDEEEVLPRCLESVKTIIDELIVVDTGSTDATRKVAEAYGAKMYEFTWRDDFAAARNYSFSKATGDYILWLDADDVLPAREAKKLPALYKKLEKEQPSVVLCPYDVGGENGQTFLRERLLRRIDGFVWQGCVHECIAPSGKILRSDVRIQHLGSKKERSERNLRIYQRYLSRGGLLSPRDRFYYGRELYYHKLYQESLAVLEPLFFDKTAWHVNQIEGCLIAAKCHLARGERELAKEALFRSFRFGEPRASVLCELGALFRQDNRNKEAVFWLTSALFCRDHSAEGDFDCPTDRNLRPLLELTCAYFVLGEHKKALFCHRQAERRFPDHPSVLYNRNFFRSKGLL